MGNLLDLHYHIAWLDIRHLVALSMDGILLSVRRSLVHLYLQLLLFVFDLLSVAGLALLGWVDALSLAIALVTGSSPLTVHAWSQLHHHGSHALSFAALASDDSLSVSAPHSVALSTDSLSFYLELKFLPVVQILQSHFHYLGEGFHLLLGLTTALLPSSHSEEIEDI
jgi:hypothetical protein